VQELIKLIKDLPEGVRDLIRYTSVAKSRIELTKLASFDRVMQRRIAEQIAAQAADSVTRAAQIVSGGPSAVSLDDPIVEFNSIIGSLWSVMDKARQYGEFQNLFDQCSAEVTRSYVTRLEQIHGEIGDWIDYLQRRAS